MDELECPAVGRPRFVRLPEAAEKLSSGRVQIVVAVEVERLDRGEPALDVARLRRWEGSFQLDHRRAGEAPEFAVEGRELVPVDWVVGVQDRDRTLKDVRAPASQGERAL